MMQQNSLLSVTTSKEISVTVIVNVTILLFRQLVGVCALPFLVPNVVLPQLPERWRGRFCRGWKKRRLRIDWISRDCRDSSSSTPAFFMVFSTWSAEGEGLLKVLQIWNVAGTSASVVLQSPNDFLSPCTFGIASVIATEYWVAISAIYHSAILLLFDIKQYCLFRPLTTLIAILLDRVGLYNEASISGHSGWLYLTILVNISIAFAFAALATFYTTLKKKLAPHEPVGKFLCIKFVIFFAFWQSVIIAILVHIGSIHAVGNSCVRAE